MVRVGAAGAAALRLLDWSRSAAAHFSAAPRVLLPARRQVVTLVPVEQGPVPQAVAAGIKAGVAAAAARTPLAPVRQRLLAVQACSVAAAEVVAVRSPLLTQWWLLLRAAREDHTPREVAVRQAQVHRVLVVLRALRASAPLAAERVVVVARVILLVSAVLAARAVLLVAAEVVVVVAHQPTVA